MYADGPSFEANLTLHTRNSFRDVSFSSYLNKAEENMVRKLANQATEPPKDHFYRTKFEDEEIDVFGAEKYFKGEIEDEVNNNNNNDKYNISKKDKKLKEFDHNFPPKLRDDQTSMYTPSVRSNTSCDSRNGLLTRAKSSPGKIENRSKAGRLFGRFGCNCMDKKSTQIYEKQFIQSKTRIDQFSSKPEERKPRNEYFSFPVLNANDLNSNSNTNSSSNSKSGNLAGKVVKCHNGNNNSNSRLSVGKKLSLLNDLEDEMYNSSSRMYNNDADSDSSSDLFEIDSFSPMGDSSCLGQRKSNYYAPSEVSIEWSVVTASAADFSVVSDYEGVRIGGGGDWRNFDRTVQGTDNKDGQKKRNGILSGCVSHKAVRVALDEYKVGGGGGPLEVGLVTSRAELNQQGLGLSSVKNRGY